MDIKDTIWLAFVSVYGVLLVTECMAIVISDIAMVLGVRLCLYALLIFTHYLRRVSTGVHTASLLYGGLIRLYLVGDTAFYPLALLLSSPDFLKLYSFLSFLLSLLRIALEYRGPSLNT